MAFQISLCKNPVSKIWLIKGIFGKSVTGVQVYTEGKIAFTTSEAYRAINASWLSKKSGGLSKQETGFDGIVKQRNINSLFNNLVPILMVFNPGTDFSPIYFV